MIVVIAIAAGALIGTAMYLLLPWLMRLLAAYFARAERRCGPVLDAARIDIEGWRRQAFFAAGPIASTIAAIVFVHPWWLTVITAVSLSLATSTISYRIALYLRRRRIAKVKSQLVDALGMVSNALRSGLSLQQGFQMVAEEMPAPIAQEFQLVVSSQQLGKTFDAALEEFKERIPLEEIDLLISSLIILRETGGNIIETLEVITHTIREEQRVKSKIKTVTTQGVAQAVVISALPFFLAGALYIIAPAYILPLFEHPLGWSMIAFMLLMQGAGMWMMKKIVTIKV